jgi:antitoxin (DNA-binding transcriptional repressor) of toxin-antitoxin stability system
MKAATLRPMKTVTLGQLRMRVARMSRTGEPVLVTERGKPLGVFRPLPVPDESIPLETRRKLYRKTSAKIARQMDAKGVTEEQLQRDFEALRANRRRQ